MTEAEWHESTDPMAMLEFLGGVKRDAVGSRNAERKLWLFVQACMERVACYLPLVERQWWERFSDFSPFPMAIDTAAAADHVFERAKLAPNSQAELSLQADLLREIFGPYPSLPIQGIGSGVLGWNDGTVRKMASVIDCERAFDQLPILADALEEAGFTNAVILDHLRRPGGHLRGCFALDAVMGKS